MKNTTQQQHVLTFSPLTRGCSEGLDAFIHKPKPLRELRSRVYFFRSRSLFYCADPLVHGLVDAPEAIGDYFLGEKSHAYRKLAAMSMFDLLLLFE